MDVFIKCADKEIIENLSDEIFDKVQVIMVEWENFDSGLDIDVVWIQPPFPSEAVENTIKEIASKYGLEVCGNYDTTVSWSAPGIKITCCEGADDDVDIEEEYEDEFLVGCDIVIWKTATYLNCFWKEAKIEWEKYCKPICVDNPFSFDSEEYDDISWTNLKFYTEKFPEWGKVIAAKK
jgi:hypothetical protein